MKKIIGLFLSAVMMFGTFSVMLTANAASGTWVGNDYYQYDVVSGSAVITRHSQHNGSDSVVYIPSSLGGYTVTELGKSAFNKKFDGVKQYVIPSTVTVIGDSAFSQGGASEVETVVIPSSVTTIGNYAFNGMSTLSSISLSEGVETIGDYAFYGADCIENIIIPSSVRSIGKCAFASCDMLNHINIRNGVKTIGDSAFAYGIYPSIVVPKSVTYIGYSAFNTTTLVKATVMNPKCEIYASSLTFYARNTVDSGKKIKLYGFDNSTICKYAKNYPYAYQFVSLTTPTSTKITKLTAKSKGFLVKWSKAANCCGYQIQYSLKSNMSSAKTIKINSSTTLSKTVSKLKKGKTYYVRVRAFNKYSGKIYNTKWSAVKKVKTK